MKRGLLISNLLIFAFCGISAQENSIFNHLGFGIGTGTTGITIDLAAPISQYIEIRAGIDYMPKFKYNTTMDTNIDNADKEHALKYAGITIPDKVDIEATNKMMTGHFLFDLFPFHSSSFHLTAGAYYGNSIIINVYNKNDKDLKPLVDYNDAVTSNPSLGLKIISVQLGDYIFAPYKTPEGGHIDSNIKVSNFRPYAGFGFGRSVPQKHHLACQCDFGAQFWKTPKMYLIDTYGETELTEKDTKEKNSDFIKILSKINIYPCLSIRLTGRIF